MDELQKLSEDKTLSPEEEVKLALLKHGSEDDKAKVDAWRQGKADGGTSAAPPP
jgi:hypothetical protein